MMLLKVLQADRSPSRLTVKKASNRYQKSLRKTEVSTRLSFVRLKMANIKYLQEETEQEHPVFVARQIFQPLLEQI